MGVEPTRERWRPQQDLKSCHITGYDTPPKSGTILLNLLELCKISDGSLLCNHYFVQFLQLINC